MHNHSSSGLDSCCAQIAALLLIWIIALLPLIFLDHRDRGPADVLTAAVSSGVPLEGAHEDDAD
jgi:hypothetical protein